MADVTVKSTMDCALCIYGECKWPETHLVPANPNDVVAEYGDKLWRFALGYINGLSAFFYVTRYYGGEKDQRYRLVAMDVAIQWVDMGYDPDMLFDWIRENRGKEDIIDDIQNEINVYKYPTQ